jgi:hypothetical protein
MTEENDLDPEGESLRQVGEQQDSFDREHEDDPSAEFLQIGYERGVKRITGKKRWDRALQKLREFHESQGLTKEEVEQLLVQYRQKGFSGQKIIRLQNEFAVWWQAEKSRKARESRKARKAGGKRGRVKSKNDKRLGVRP